MDNTRISADIKKLTGIETGIEIILAPFTTWKIGGPAEMLVKVKRRDELIDLIHYCINNSVQFTILGKGSNVLISDKGIRGLVIINEYSEITIGNREKINTEAIPKSSVPPRVDKNDYSDMDYVEESPEQVEVTIASGTILSFAINHLISEGFTGLQWFAGIPGTIGGAIFNNIHGGTHFFSEYILSVLIIDEKGNLLELKKEDMKFDYDQSILHDKKYIIIEAKFALYLGDSKKALITSQTWAKKKAETQPFNSGGCCFKNISNEERDKYKFASNGWGYIIDNILHLKGTRKGDAIISNRHGAFIENLGNATAVDVLDLLNIIYSNSKNKLEITPKAEIVFLGFDKNDIEKFQ